MGIRARKSIQENRRLRVKRRIAISPFTIFLLGFGLIYWTILMFTTVIAVDCAYAIIWVSGWFDFASLYQWSVVAIGLSAAVWLARVLLIKELNRIETTVQLIFILGLAAVGVVQKTYLFPYATPDRAQVEKIAQLIWRNDLWLMEGHDTLIDVKEGWKYDYPPPPFASSPEHPSWDESINLRLPKIFESSNSPTWKEYQRMFTCYADYQSAVSDYERDIELWNKYWEEFDNWYATNNWRYGNEYPFWRYRY